MRCLVLEINSVRYEVLMAKMLMMFWLVMQCGLVGRYQCFTGTW
jgi:hypothetical protein